MMAGRVLCHRNKCVKVLSWGLHSTGMEATVLWFYQCTKQHPSVFMPFNHMGHCGWWYLFWHWLWDQNGNHRKWKCHQDWVSYEFQTMEILVYGNKGGLQPLAVSWQFWPLPKWPDSTSRPLDVEKQAGTCHVPETYHEICAHWLMP